MIANPAIGSTVQVWYRRQAAPYMPQHGATAVVTRVARGRPRNVQVRLPDGRRTVVPCGNIRRAKERP